MDTNTITQTLREEIEAGSLPPGTVLKQEELAARFGVSRQPIRHALERLHESGLLEKRPDRSLAVTGLRGKDVRELCQIRISLEVTALELSAPNLSPSALRKAKRLNEDLFEEDDPDMLAELDQEFHATLYGACGNQRLLTMIEGFRSEAKRAYALQPKGSRPRSAFYEEHQQILDAIAAGDIATACKVLSTHIGVTAGTLIPIDQS
ncbi:GntR family transcriptional regulator [Thalassospira sp.]|uniref:GntR family transcriptional regulator n=1 Tax=Thalassospira sp. TaxID=1912094 RepID=UPI000C56B003|nr:GntR family transcriptional regulator [Thalassospira sp.]MBC04778.1 transcriptional regulator [Thalassospira sp.]|tara:strand:- start:9728 stop:10348 length:621 start_codon:yes stop_codon:yes gene_type:complete